MNLLWSIAKDLHNKLCNEPIEMKGLYKLHKALFMQMLENICKQVTIGFGFTSEWIKLR